MDFPQRARNLQRVLRAKLAGAQARYASAQAARANAAREAEAAKLRAKGSVSRRRLRRGIAIAFTACAVVLLSYPLVAWWRGKVDDDLAFAAPQGNGSRIVATVSALLDREVNHSGWTPNDPVFFPTALLTAKPNFQRGIVYALAAITASFAGDSAMREAATELHYPPDVWLWNPATSLQFDSSESEYRRAIAALARVRDKPVASFGRDRDVLTALLGAMRAGLDQDVLALDTRIRAPAHFPFSHRGTALFYTVKGNLYADALVLTAARQDYAALIAGRGLSADWNAMTEIFARAAALRPGLVMNGAPDSSLVPCHLCTEGFFLVRADAAMTELAGKLK